VAAIIAAQALGHDSQPNCATALATTIRTHGRQTKPPHVYRTLRARLATLTNAH
jgi:hypothetical protein